MWDVKHEVNHTPLPHPSKKDIGLVQIALPHHVLHYAKCMTVETESMADRATRAALDAENEFKKFLDDLNQYEYMKVYDDEQKVCFICLF